MTSTPPWHPTTVLRHVRSLATGAHTMVVETDQGEGYLKALGSPAGPHVLACEWVGTKLAAWLGLPTFEVALLPITDDDELAFRSGGMARPGPAFISRAEKGRPWGGSAADLRLVANREDITRLVVLDTWIRNRDRHHPDPSARRPNYDNVFLSEEGAPEGKLRLLAMDHSHCLSDQEELTARLAESGFLRDERVYGLFPEFAPTLDRAIVRSAARRLRGDLAKEAEAVVSAIPLEWEVDPPVRAALLEFITGRARFVADTLESRLFLQGEFDFDPAEDETP